MPAASLCKLPHPLIRTSFLYIHLLCILGFITCINICIHCLTNRKPTLRVQHLDVFCSQSDTPVFTSNMVSLVPKNKFLFGAPGPIPVCGDMAGNVRHSGWSQMWPASPPGSVRDRWGSSKCLWDVFVPSSAHTGLICLIWPEAGETDIWGASIQSVLNWKTLIFGKRRIFLKHAWHHLWPLRGITSLHSPYYPGFRILQQSTIQDDLPITRATSSSTNGFQWIHYSHRSIEFIP